MEPQTNAEEMLARVSEVAKEIRKSDAYPAIIGGIAGGVAGALMAAMIASRVAPRSAAPASEASATKASRPGLSVQDVMQLVTVIASLARQVQGFVQEQKK